MNGYRTASSRFASICKAFSSTSFAPKQIMQVISMLKDMKGEVKFQPTCRGAQLFYIKQYVPQDLLQVLWRTGG